MSSTHLDGDHTYGGVKQDYEMYRGFVRPGGYIAFHDVVESARHRDRNCNVARLWSEVLGEKIELNAHHNWAGIGVVRSVDGEELRGESVSTLAERPDRR